jgi:hypothetical protein
MTIKHQKFLNSNNLLAKDMDIKSDEKAIKIDTNVQPVDVKSNEKGAGVGIVLGRWDIFEILRDVWRLHQFRHHVHD